MRMTFILTVIFILLSQVAYCASPDTLVVFDASLEQQGELSEKWSQLLPPKEVTYTNYSVVRSVDGRYLRALSSSGGSWLEYDMGDMDVSLYPTMEWTWKVDLFPEITWENAKINDDFAMRIELVYDFKGGNNPINYFKKGFFRSLFKRYPPELIVSYVWAVNVPVEKAYLSPNSDRTVIIPIESGDGIRGRWIHEKRNVLADLEERLQWGKLYLKKIRVRADTDNSGTVAESGLKRITLIGASETAAE